MICKGCNEKEIINGLFVFRDQCDCLSVFIRLGALGCPHTLITSTNACSWECAKKICLPELNGFNKNKASNFTGSDSLTLRQV